MRRIRWLFGLALVAPTALAGACSDATLVEPIGVDGGNAGGGGAGGESSGPTVVVTHPDAPPLPGESSCDVTVTTNIPLPSAMHVPVCTPVEYATNPPSGGNHWPFWAAFKEYAAPVRREMYVHDLEHGAVVLAYRCAGACPDVVEFLEAAMAKAKADPLCGIFDVPSRIVLTPDPLLDAPIAAAAWGATYVATCLDPASLAAFIVAHYAKSPENTCAPGVDPTDLDAGAAVACDGSGGGGGQ